MSLTIEPCLQGLVQIPIDLIPIKGDNTTFRFWRLYVDILGNVTQVDVYLNATLCLL